MKIYVVVEVYQLVVSGVYVTEDEDKAKAKFEEYTGVNFDQYKKDLESDELMPSEDILGDYDQTKIFEFEDLPTDFVICTHSHGCPLRWPQTNP